MGEQSREKNIRYFKELKACCRLFLESLASVSGYIETYSAYFNNKEKVLYWKMTVEYGRRNMQMCMEWVQNCIDQLKGNNDI